MGKGAHELKHILHKIGDQREGSVAAKRLACVIQHGVLRFCT